MEPKDRELLVSMNERLIRVDDRVGWLTQEVPEQRRKIYSIEQELAVVKSVQKTHTTTFAAIGALILATVSGAWEAVARAFRG